MKSKKRSGTDTDRSEYRKSGGSSAGGVKRTGSNVNGSRGAGSSGTKRAGSRRLAGILAVLLVCLAFFALSDSPAVSDLRDRILGSAQENANDGSAGSEESEESGRSASEPGTQQDASEAGTQQNTSEAGKTQDASSGNVEELNPDDLPEYNGEHYVKVAGGVPAFPEVAFRRASLVRDGDPDADAGSVGGDVQADALWYTEGSKKGRIDSGGLIPYEYYGELDELGRCTVAYGCLGEETMPAEGVERGDISSIHPSGWAKAQNWERSHLIAWALSDENANERNLVTGTHYLNHDGMRPLEEEVEHYIWNTGNHVLYMARPVFAGDELVPRGVQMAAWSCEDHGKGISFNVYCYNVTPGAEINYSNGVVTTEEQAAQEARAYVLNTRSGVFHYPSCDGAKSIYKKNRQDVTATRKEMTDQGYIPCGYCEP